MPRDIRSLTGLRGLAALSVVVFHEAGNVTATGPADTVLRHGYNAVDLFFVLSGFVMALNYGNSLTQRLSFRSYAGFLLKRLARIYPVYAVITVFTFIVFQLGFSHLGQIANPVPTLVLNLLLVQSWWFAESIVGPAWSISTEWAAYLACPVLMMLALGKASWRPVLFLAVAFLALAAISFAPDAAVVGDQPSRMGPLDLYGVSTIAPLLRCLGGFSVGLLAYRWQDRVGATVTLPLVVLIIATLLFPGTDVLLILLFMLLVMSLSEDTGLVARILGHKVCYVLGDLSYSVYLLHPRFNPVKVALQARLRSYHVPWADPVGIVLTLPIIVACAAVTYTVIEKPGRRFLRSVFELRTSRPIEQEPSAP